MQSATSTAVVRCLGWENMELPLEDLAYSIARTLDDLAVPFSVGVHVDQCGNQVPAMFTASPEQPPSSVLAVLPPEWHEQAADAPLASLEDRSGIYSPRLNVSIGIFKADLENEGQFHVRVRRMQGGHWRFQAFYKTFRQRLSVQLGLMDEKALSVFSPMGRKRKLVSSQPAWPAMPTGASRVPLSPRQESLPMHIDDQTVAAAAAAAAPSSGFRRVGHVPAQPLHMAGGLGSWRR